MRIGALNSQSSRPQTSATTGWHNRAGLPPPFQPGNFQTSTNLKNKQEVRKRLPKTPRQPSSGCEGQDSSFTGRTTNGLRELTRSNDTSPFCQTAETTHLSGLEGVMTHMLAFSGSIKIPS